MGIPFPEMHTRWLSYAALWPHIGTLILEEGLTTYTVILNILPLA